MISKTPYKQIAFKYSGGIIGIINKVESSPCDLDVSGNFSFYICQIVVGDRRSFTGSSMGEKNRNICNIIFIGLIFF